ncbi:SRPBCC family protein [Streptomyces actuosus]|uniref:SRPBCC family protein n=1 Tax=Streptomyces actuosus TaxID=1885 RepID=A0ABS2VHT1_STRAS|nr:SRPBCC family protein [Streptomyces actuosus]MBN0042646.1 SRPBCC family protein [Streptomyces actuosus]
MELHHEFTVPVPLDDAWQALLDIERVAPCLPGASVEEFDGKTVTGSVKVKVGPVTVTYKGTAVFEEQDEQAHRLVLAANGRETRGQGTARARVTATLAEDDGTTTVSVRTDLTVTGRPAQFGRGVLAEVGERLVTQFASCLAQRIAGPAETAPGASAGEVPSSAAIAEQSPPAAADEPLDLFRTAGVPIAKRAAVAVAAVAAVVWAALRLRRWRRH